MFNENQIRNMLFIASPKNKFFWIHLITCFCNLALVIIYIVFGQKYKLPRSIIAINVLTIVRRSFTIAIRYATTNSLVLRELKERVLDTRELYFEFAVLSWIEAPSDVYDIHIHASMVRLQIEDSTFFYKNVSNLSDNRIK